MPRRESLILAAPGERFRFYYDLRLPELLHITFQHGTTPEDAITTFFTESTQWNEERQRFKTNTESHVLYWARHSHDDSVVVISCFRQGDE